MLKLTEVHKTYSGDGVELKVLRGVSLELSEGAAAVITGPSGCGKSTLLHIMGTLDRPSKGSVEIDGRDPFKLSDDELARFRNDDVGFIFQGHHLLPQLSVLENVLLPTLAFSGSSRGNSLQRAHQLLNKVGLDQRAHYRPAQLSGGERQRASVARALINQPKLLLCDEPTGSLDGETARTVSDLLFRLHREQGGVLVVVTHSLELANRFNDRFELREGRCLRV